ncbi:MAG: hypothetical protein ABI550_03480 [Ignavibacteriaceae bacterium]
MFNIKDETYSKILIILFSCSFIYIISFILFSDFRKLIFITPDDASYYLKIAQNFSKGSGFSFDGINQTNGFQPLWQYILIPFAYFKIKPELMLRIAFILQVILLSASAIIFCRAQSKIFKAGAILPGGIIFLMFVFFNGVNGMETALMIFFVSLLYFYCIKKNMLEENNFKDEFITGMILGLVILSRLDMIFLASAIGIFSMVNILLNKEGRQRSLIKISLIVSGTAIIVSPYLTYNYLKFGNIIPISGYLKTTFPLYSEPEKLRYIFSYRESIFAFSAFIYFIWFLFTLKKVRKQSSNIKAFTYYMAIFALFVMIYFLYTILFLNWVIFSWYFISYSIFASLAVSLPFHYFLKFRKQRLRDVAVIFISALMTVYGIYKIYNLYENRFSQAGNNWNIESYNAAEWIKNNTDSNEIFAMRDAGHFSFFSDRRVINLDGLVNNFEYQEILKNKKLNEYLKKHDVRYLVQHGIWNRDEIIDGNYDTLQIDFISHRYSSESDPILVRKKDEFYRSAPYLDDNFRVSFIIWKLNQQ